MTEPPPFESAPLQQGPAPRPTNGLGLAGFIVSLIGLVLTCGLLCPLGLLLSAFGLFRPPRGFAIAGVLIGLVGSALLLFVGLVLFGTVSGLAGMEAFDGLEPDPALTQARDRVDALTAETGGVPDEASAGPLVEAIVDRHGTPLRYSVTEDGYLIRGAGRDGVFETLDDVRAFVEVEPRSPR